MKESSSRFLNQRIAPRGDATTFGRARRRRGRATLKRFEDPPPSPNRPHLSVLGAQGLGIGLACRGSHPFRCVMFLGFCRAGGLAIHGWLTPAASLGWSVEIKMLRPSAHPMVEPSGKPSGSSPSLALDADCCDKVMTKYQDLRDGRAPGRLARGDISADRGHGRAEIGRMSCTCR
jgi:hypothetical protein